MARKPIEVRVKGGTELMVGSTRLVKKIDAAAAERFLTVANQTAGIVRARVPRRSGALAASVGTETGDRSALIRMGRGYPTQLYAGWIEFGGTRGRPMVKRGRYVYPTALASQPMAVLAAGYAADNEIRGFSWPRVT